LSTNPGQTFTVRPGVPYPQGATADARGVNFAVHSQDATKVEVCLFSPTAPHKEIARLPLLDVTNYVWHGHVEGLGPGTLYGFRAHGPNEPSKGQRFNPDKLLVDPFARAVHGKPDWSFPLVGDQPGDSAGGAPKSVVVADDFDWGDDKRPSVIWRKTVLYELHVKGFTARHPKIPPELRGTYAGLGHDAAVQHLVDLGVTSVELLPVQEMVSEGFLAPKGLTNYWGYNPLALAAPDQRFATNKTPGAAVNEFKQMVKALHRAGLEVILDVVYNHTCEGNHLGPTLSLRGLDNQTYYWLEARDRAHYRDFTGCGNSLNLSHAQTLKLVTDSLRVWVQEFRVDGFRFDLCTTIGRSGDGAFSREAAFFQAVHQDPVLSRVKLIAEPWDLGADGYRLGHYPILWGEWNDRYRESIRRYWRGDDRLAAEIGYRVAGSSDLFKMSGRRPMSSINYVACHDGFTLHDLVTYGRKHNELNGEENRDGASENHASNYGVEGETDDPVVNAVRDRQKKNLIATLALSVGTPMLGMGDEQGRTQFGNNNAYCQDNELSWMNWELDARGKSLLAFTQKVFALRKKHPVLQRRNFFMGQNLEDSRFRDLSWFKPDGNEMGARDWEEPHLRCLGWFLGGDAIGGRAPDGSRLSGESLLIYVNAHHEAVEVTLPGNAWGDAWEVELETAREVASVETLPAAAKYLLASRALVVLRQTRKP
jgi:isoamylase